VIEGLQKILLKKSSPFLVLEILPTYSLTDEKTEFQKKKREEKINSNARIIKLCYATRK